MMAVEYGGRSAEQIVFGIAETHRLENGRHMRETEKLATRILQEFWLKKVGNFNQFNVICVYMCIQSYRYVAC